MVRMRFLITLMFIGIVSVGMNAQQDAQYTQYMYNTLSVNPAYAGSRGQLSFAGLYRSQWVGLDGAPETFTLNLHSPIRNLQLETRCHVSPAHSIHVVQISGDTPSI